MPFWRRQGKVKQAMKITCVVDDRASQDSALRAEHGASFAIEAEGRTVLFDTGQSSEVLLSNMARLGLRPEAIDALVLSHAHYDHTGGLAGLLDRVQGIPLYAHPDLFTERFRRTDTSLKKVGPSSDRAELAGRVDLRLSAEPVEVIPGVWTSGEIGDRTEPEGRSPTHSVRQGDGWIADPYRDDLSVVLEAADGLVLVCGCCHAGLLNTMAQVRSAFGRDPGVVVGGTHLRDLDAATLDHVAQELRQCGSPRLWLGHCTGERAFRALQEAFGDRVSLCQAGTVLDF
jgi:7,8-dihydropterin-6-yl-methyl-4-(beta-D-ribofuranosyl)aminobenzene 5'-phosphate synthase